MGAGELAFPVLLLASPFVGSFLGVVITRDGAGALAGRSHCDHCGHALGVADLVPVFSWAMLRGKCRYCGAALGHFYPLIELAAAVPVLWAATAMSGWVLVITVLFGWILLTLSVIDWRSQRLPDAGNMVLAALGLVAAELFDQANFADHVIGLVAGLGLFALLAVVYRRLRNKPGLGFGDAKLLGALGAWVSWQGLPSVVFLAAIGGLIFVCARLLVGGIAWKELSQTRLAFGPFLAAGGWLIWLYGPLMPR